MKIKWEDYVTNVAVLEKAQANSIEATIIKHRFGWIGLVQCMSNTRLSRHILCSKRSTSKRPHSCFLQRYKDQLWLWRPRNLGRTSGRSQTLVSSHLACCRIVQRRTSKKWRGQTIEAKDLANPTTTTSIYQVQLAQEDVACEDQSFQSSEIPSIHYP